MDDENTYSTRRDVLKLGGTVAGVALGGSAVGVGWAKADRSHDSSRPKAKREWISTWTASPHAPSTSLGDYREGFVDRTLRSIVPVSRGGDGIRVRLTNRYGDQAARFSNVTVGIREARATLAPGSLRPVTFSGNRSVTVRAGTKVLSDPIDLAVAPEQDLAVNLYAGESTGPPTAHQSARKTSYIAAGDHTAHRSGSDFSETTTSWFFLEGIEVTAKQRESTVVCFGDSITDSLYPNYLARRLNNHPSIPKAVVNAGIGGNRVLTDSPPDSGFGESAIARFDHDVLAQTGASDVIFLEGINDIGFGANNPAASVSAEEIIRGHKQIISRAHAAGLDIFGATLTPFVGAPYYSQRGGEKRRAVNEFIRTSNEYDGVIDLDKALRDPERPRRLRPEYDSGDHLHPSDAGYRAMANAVDLSLLKR
ncbi:SGNH/GDSL hydrolase family protein [Halocatena pleomorpha]|uniref:SGNH/GDSL hydrolase family protein n=1 Tax=Halocatena pleomorpha TaxID=1785090 RepID=UPI00163A2471|nr:SGNH/GDSL hydrolase family protein [Halocatena pleomorpha]